MLNELRLTHIEESLLALIYHDESQKNITTAILAISLSLCQYTILHTSIESMLKKQDIIQCRVVDLADNGQGVVKHNDLVGFVSGALAEELVSIRVEKIKKNFFLASLIDILEPSPDRQKPFCEHFGNCGGCQLQHLAYDAHAKTKTQQWLQLYKKICGHPCTLVPNTVFSTPKGYRRKARFSCRYVPKKDKVCVGYRESNPRYVLDGRECPLLMSCTTLFQDLSDMLSTLSVKASIPQVEYIVDSEHTHLIFRMLSTPTALDIAAIQKFCQQESCLGYLQTTSKQHLIALGDKQSHDVHDQIMSQTFDDVTLLFHAQGLAYSACPHDFVQVNEKVNESMLSLVCSWVNTLPSGRVLDLFCGIGNFTLPIAVHHKEVIGMEISESMVQRAHINASMNQLKASFIVTDLSQLEPGQWHHGEFDTLIIDPPRSGAKEVVAIMPEINPSHIVYIACDPSTALRDVKELLQQGYELEQVALMDMFAQTCHIETAMLLKKKRSQ